MCFEVVFRVRFWTLFLDTVQCPPTVGGHCFRTIIKTRRWTHSGGQCLQEKIGKEQSSLLTNARCHLVGGQAVRSIFKLWHVAFSTFEYQGKLFPAFVSETMQDNPVWQFDARMSGRPVETMSVWLRRGPDLDVRSTDEERLHVPSKGTILQWDLVLAGMYDWLENLQALRAVCRDTVSEVMLEHLCHAAFHDIPLSLDPYSDPTSPLWSRCIHHDFMALD